MFYSFNLFTVFHIQRKDSLFFFFLNHLLPIFTQIATFILIHHPHHHNNQSVKFIVISISIMITTDFKWFPLTLVINFKWLLVPIISRVIQRRLIISSLSSSFFFLIFIFSFFFLAVLLLNFIISSSSFSFKNS